MNFRKAALTVVTGVSGSGKSSLVADVLEAEARRRFLESLSMYERQGTREGPEAAVEAVSGLGVAVAVTPERRLYDQRATVGTATEISRHLAVLMARIGARRCLACGASMVRGELWRCPACGATAGLAQPRHFLPATYAAACRTCQGMGTLQRPAPEKLIIHPERAALRRRHVFARLLPQGLPVRAAQRRLRHGPGAGRGAMASIRRPRPGAR